MQISEKAIEVIRNSNKAKGELMICFDIGEKSVLNWLDKKDIRFTTPAAVEAIMKWTDLQEDEILVTEKTEA